ncbi:MAG: molecular chaperone GrpE, partial [Verrucomicrobiales bacterium]
MYDTLPFPTGIGAQPTLFENDMKDEEQIEEIIEALQAANENAGDESADAPTTVEEPVLEEGLDEGSPESGEAFAELQNRLLRLQADFDNFRKRTRREKEAWSRDAQERIVMELLTVLDHFELGLQNAEPSETTTGFQMILGQFSSALKKFNVAPVMAEGEVFNPELHEAISQMPSDEFATNQVLAQTRKGYTMGEKLLRPAQVVVSQGPGKADAEPAAD